MNLGRLPVFILCLIVFVPRCLKLRFVPKSKDIYGWMDKSSEINIHVTQKSCLQCNAKVFNHHIFLHILVVRWEIDVEKHLETNQQMSNCDNLWVLFQNELNK